MSVESEQKIKRQEKGGREYYLVNLVLAVMAVGLSLWLIERVWGYDRDRVALTDFGAYLTGVEIVKNGWEEELFDIETQRQMQRGIYSIEQELPLLPYRHLTGGLLVYWVVSWMGLVWGYRWWVLINMGLVWWLISRFGKLFDSSSFRWLGAAATWLFFPVMSALVLGQSSVVILCLMWGVYWLWKQGKDEWLAYVLVTTVMIKLPYGVLVPFFWWLVDKRRFGRGLIAALGFWLLVGLGVHGWKPLVDFPRFLIATQKVEYGSDMGGMMGVLSWLIRLGEAGGLDLDVAWYWLINVGMYVGGWWFFGRMFKDRRKELMVFVVAVVFPILFSGHVWSHSLIIWLIPMMLLLVELERRPGQIGKAVGVVGLMVYPLIVPVLMIWEKVVGG